MTKVFMRVMAWRLGRFAEDKILIGAQEGLGVIGDVDPLGIVCTLNTSNVGSNMEFT